MTNKNKIPGLKTGMFGIEDDGECFVVVNEDIVYEGGQHEEVSLVDEYGNFTRAPECHIVKLFIDCSCFKQAKDGRATLIWERPEDEV